MRETTPERPNPFDVVVLHKPDGSIIELHCRNTPHPCESRHEIEKRHREALRRSEEEVIRAETRKNLLLACRDALVAVFWIVVALYLLSEILT